MDAEVRKRGQLIVAVCASLIAVLLLAAVIESSTWLRFARSPPPLDNEHNAELSSQVVESNYAPVVDVPIRLCGGSEVARTDGSGRFTVVRRSGADRFAIWLSGYYVTAFGDAQLGDHIFLRRLPDEDNEDYHWHKPDPKASWKDYKSCGECHRAIYDEWKAGLHAACPTPFTSATCLKAQLPTATWESAGACDMSARMAWTSARRAIRRRKIPPS